MSRDRTLEAAEADTFAQRWGCDFERNLDPARTRRSLDAPGTSERDDPDRNSPTASPTLDLNSTRAASNPFSPSETTIRLLNCAGRALRLHRENKVGAPVAVLLRLDSSSTSVPPPHCACGAR